MKKGKRYLVIDKGSSDWTLNKEHGDVIEVKALELSPKGRVKLKFLNGHIEWDRLSNYHVVEQL